MKKKQPRILVILHLYYMENWSCISKYLNNLEDNYFDLCVSYTDVNKDEKVLEDIIMRYPQTVFYEVPNRGYDVGPFLECLKHIDLGEYDIVFKLHTKAMHLEKRYIYDRLFKGDDWFRYLYESILSKRALRKVVANLFERKGIGLVAANNLIICDPPYRAKLVKQWGDKLNVETEGDYLFVAGTCFAVKAEVLKEIQALKLEIGDFEVVRRGKFSLAHAMERLICISIQNQGERLYGINCCLARRLLRKIESIFIPKSNSSILLNDKRFCIDDEFFGAYFSTVFVEDYEIIKVKLKDIRREWKGQHYALKECAPYRFLEGEYKGYLEYCEANSRDSIYDMSPAKFDELISNIEMNGFNEKYIPIVDERNVVLDGQHRLCVLLKKYGLEYEVNVLKVKCKSLIFVKIDKSILRRIKSYIGDKRIYIYGAGRFGEKYFDILTAQKVPIDGFVVSGTQVQKEYLGKKVFSISEIDRGNSVLLLALSEKNRGEVMKILEEKGYSNYIILE